MKELISTVYKPYYLIWCLGATNGAKSAAKRKKIGA
jgi:hypothetical protein